MMRDYVVRYGTKKGIFEFEIEADEPAGASDACYYEHGGDPGYKELAVIEV